MFWWIVLTSIVTRFIQTWSWPLTHLILYLFYNSIDILMMQTLVEREIQVWADAVQWQLVKQTCVLICLPPKRCKIGIHRSASVSGQYSNIFYMLLEGTSFEIPEIHLNELITLDIPLELPSSKLITSPTIFIGRLQTYAQSRHMISQWDSSAITMNYLHYNATLRSKLPNFQITLRT